MSRRWLAEKIAKITNEYNTSKPKDALEAETVCDRDGEVYWESLNQCMADEVVAVADETTDGKLVRNDGTIFSLSGATNAVGLNTPITANKYLAYTLPANITSWEWLRGMKVEITVDDGIVTPMSSSILKTVFDGGATSRTLITAS